MPGDGCLDGYAWKTRIFVHASSCSPPPSSSPSSSSFIPFLAPDEFRQVNRTITIGRGPWPVQERGVADRHLHSQGPPSHKHTCRPRRPAHRRGSCRSGRAGAGSERRPAWGRTATRRAAAGWGQRIGRGDSGPRAREPVPHARGTAFLTDPHP